MVCVCVSEGERNREWAALSLFCRWGKEAEGGLMYIIPVGERAKPRQCDGLIRLATKESTQQERADG